MNARYRIAIAANVVACMIPVLTGCMATTPQPATHIEEQPLQHSSKAERTHRHLTNSWGNIGRAGAAMHQPAFIDVLGIDGSIFTYQGVTAPIAQSMVIETIAPLPSSMSPSLRKPTMAIHNKGYSIYEQQRWERYCNAGKGMNQTDWNFVLREKEQVPQGLFAHCSPPDFSPEQYAQAWSDFCSGKTVDSFYAAVIKKTEKPTSIKKCNSR